ncbi:MAG: 4Fe-4S binding protein, partial [Candidatus Cloacimonetes bacterium]|nr:4Fe-4S binding protein [Candidatus Cloacimonadota bacterium]
ELKEGDAHPIINYDKCIKCMCCHEMCPYQAIFVHKSFLAKFIIK